jgi:hypothetical protein
MSSNADECLAWLDVDLIWDSLEIFDVLGFGREKDESCFEKKEKVTEIMRVMGD